MFYSLPMLHPFIFLVGTPKVFEHQGSGFDGKGRPAAATSRQTPPVVDGQRKRKEAAADGVGQNGETSFDHHRRIESGEVSEVFETGFLSCSYSTLLL